MRPVIQRMVPVLQLTRVTGAFSAVANVWFVIVWTRAFTEEPGTEAIRERPLWVLLTGGAVTALGLFTFGAGLNDILDAKRDRTLRPNRPLAADRISEEIAISVVIGTLILSVLGALLLGPEAVLLTSIVAIGVTIYNVAGKFVPAIGLPVLAVVYAGHMLAPNVELVFVWPVWLVMTHAMIVGGLAHVMERRVPRLSPRAVIFAIAGWAACSAALIWKSELGEVSPRFWPDWVPLSAGVWVLAMVVVFAAMCLRRVARLGFNDKSGEKVRRYGTLWPAVYACAWLVGAQQAQEAWPLIALLVVGILGMTALREAYALVEEPIEFRR